MLTDEVTCPIAVRPRCDMVPEGQFVIELEENTVCPKCDMEANETNGKEVENNAVRADDIDAEEMTDNKIEERRSPSQERHGCKLSRKKHDNENGAAAAKKILEVNDEVSKEDVEIRRLTEERRNTSKGEKQRLKDLSKQIRKCIRDKKRTKRQEKENNTRRLQRNQEQTRHQICKKKDTHH